MIVYLENCDIKYLKQNYNNDKLYIVYLKPYKNGTKIKVYDEKDNPIGDIPEKKVSKFLKYKIAYISIEHEIDNDTGMYDYLAFIEIDENPKQYINSTSSNNDNSPINIGLIFVIAIPALLIYFLIALL